MKWLAIKQVTEGEALSQAYIGVYWTKERPMWVYFVMLLPWYIRRWHYVFASGEEMTGWVYLAMLARFERWKIGGRFWIEPSERSRFRRYVRPHVAKEMYQ